MELGDEMKNIDLNYVHETNDAFSVQQKFFLLRGPKQFIFQN
ncbi:hypothetical protein THOM_0729 [Trachipleistophora hominis]|uniref:Uncharacterized protein n=1 Tax=Trachipleistophora hominis TaxID=72359 RepID=L7JXY1_TRAHO|nr:hypothetical protein THOM_0729 [Trachipleistophora hominis]